MPSAEKWGNEKAGSGMGWLCCFMMQLPAEEERNYRDGVGCSFEFVSKSYSVNRRKR